MQQFVSCMQQAHELSQQRLNIRQRYFIVATYMPIRNQLNVYGNKHTSNEMNSFLDVIDTWAIAAKVKF
jgi:hypothetical protein